MDSSIRIIELNLTTRTRNRLIANDIYTIGHLIEYRESQLRALPLVGDQFIHEIKSTLKKHNCTLLPEPREVRVIRSLEELLAPVALRVIDERINKRKTYPEISKITGLTPAYNRVICATSIQKIVKETQKMDGKAKLAYCKESSNLYIEVESTFQAMVKDGSLSTRRRRKRI